MKTMLTMFDDTVNDVAEYHYGGDDDEENDDDGNDDECHV